LKNIHLWSEVILEFISLMRRQCMEETDDIILQIFLLVVLTN